MSVKSFTVVGSRSACFLPPPPQQQPTAYQQGPGPPASRPFVLIKRPHTLPYLACLPLRRAANSHLGASILVAAAHLDPILTFADVDRSRGPACSIQPSAIAVALQHLQTARRTAVQEPLSRKSFCRRRPPRDLREDPLHTKHTHTARFRHRPPLQQQLLLPILPIN